MGSIFKVCSNGVIATQTLLLVYVSHFQLQMSILLIFPELFNSNSQIEAPKSNFVYQIAIADFYFLFLHPSPWTVLLLCAVTVLFYLHACFLWPQNSYFNRHSASFKNNRVDPLFSFPITITLHISLTCVYSHCSSPFLDWLSGKCL